MIGNMRNLTATEFTLIQPFKFAARQRTISSIPAGFVLLKPVVAGICGSEILYFKGEKEKEKLEKRLPMCLLHEGVAEVVATGEGVKLQTGTHVVVNPMLPCGRCVSCRLRIGDNFCQNSKYMAATEDGLARTLLLYPENRVIPVPEGIKLEAAALTEPLSIALNAYEAAEISQNDKVAVIGDGPIGYMTALITSFLGGTLRENLCLIGIVDEKLSLAKDFSTTVNSIKEKQRLKGLFQSFDVTFEAVGGRAQEITLDEAFDLLKPSGRCIALGLSGKKVPVDVDKLINKGLTLQGSVRSRMEHFERIIGLLKASEFRNRVERVISEKRFIIKTAEDLEAAFRYADTEEGEARTKPGRVMVNFP